MVTSDIDSVSKNYYSLIGLNKVFEDATKENSIVELNLVREYERFNEVAQKEIPGLLIQFNKEDYFSHDNGRYGRYYHSDGIKAHIARNIGILKSRVSKNESSPVIQSKNFDFIADPKLKTILERDYKEILRNIISENWKSTIILSGGSIEAILLDLLLKDKTIALSSIKAPKESDLNKWDLNDLVEVSVEEKIIGNAVARLTHSVREYRNLIHPGVEVRKDLKVEPEEAKIAVEVLNILIRELS